MLPNINPLRFFVKSFFLKATQHWNILISYWHFCGSWGKCGLHAFSLLLFFLLFSSLSLSLPLSLSLASPPLFAKPKKKKLPKKKKNKKQNKEFFQCTQSLFFFSQFPFENEMIKSLSLAIPKAPVAVAVAAAAAHHHHPHQLPPPLCLVANSLRFSARGGNKVCAQQRCRLVRTMASTSPAGGTKVQKSEEEWRTVLNPEQFRILREKGTEWVHNFLLLNKWSILFSSSC